LDVAKTLGNALGIELGTFEGGVGVVVLEVGGCFVGAKFVEGIGCDIMDIDELAAGLTGHSAAPRTIGLVATLNVVLALLLVDGIDKTTTMTVAFVPLVARREGEEYGNSPLFLGIAYHLFQVPAIGVDDLIDAAAFHTIDGTGVFGCGKDTPFFAVLDAADVVVTELDEHDVTLLQGVINHLPTTFVNVGTGGTSSHRLILEDTLVGIENGIALTAPPPHTIGMIVFVLACGISTKEHHRLARLTVLVASLGNNLVVQAGFQESELRVLGSLKPLSGTGCIHACPVG